MKDKNLIIKVDDEFLEKVDYIEHINGYKNKSDTVRKTIEKEWRKEHGCISCTYSFMVKDSESSYHTVCGITHKVLTHEDLLLNPIDCPRWTKAGKDFFPCGCCKCRENGKCIILDAEVDPRTRDGRCPLGKEKVK